MRLKELRINKKLTQEEIANFINTSITCYNYYEKEKREPAIDTLCKLADFYNITLDYLVGRDFKNDIGYLDELDMNILKVTKQLNINNKRQALAYVSGLFTGQH